MASSSESDFVEIADDSFDIDDIDIFLSLQAAVFASFSAPSNRLPLETWEQIGEYLYPSELCRLSRVSRWLYVCVGSLRVWEKWFVKTHGTKQRLHAFARVPEPRCYMRFMCAISLLVCEECGSCAKLESLPETRPWEMPFPWSTLFSCPRKVHMCGTCRRITFNRYLHREPYPPEINSSFLLKDEILSRYRSLGIREEDVDSIQARRGGGRKHPSIRYHEGGVRVILRRRFGGEVGMCATAATIHRIQLQTLVRLRSMMLEQLQ